MTDERLRTRLQLLQEACSAATGQLKADIDVCAQDRATVWADIQALQRRLAQLERHEHNLRDTLVSQAEQCAGEQRDAAVAALKDSFASFVRGHGYWIQRAHLKNRIQALWTEDRVLEARIETYHKMETDTEQILSSVPDLIRDAVAQTLRAEQEKIRAQITPFLSFQAELGALRPEQPFTLQVVVVHEPDDALISWILPFPADEAALPTDAAPIVSQVADEVMKSIGTFGKHKGWSIEDIEAKRWEGFAVLLALARYDGEQPIDMATQTLLAETLQGTPLFRDIDLEVRVELLPQAAWACGHQDIALVTPAAAEEAEDELAERETAQPLRETSQGWYTIEDLRSWGHKKDSKLTPQARRLRTLLLRMVARGSVGAAAAPLHLLCETLPPKHAVEMRRGIESLLGAGLLRSVEAETAHAGVTINPDMLTEVQSLISREPTLFWTEIGVQEPVPAVA
jgi:hypothetical protein